MWYINIKSKTKMSKIIQISWVSHNAAFTSAFTNLRLQNAFCDVTVCSRGNYFPAHRLILAAFSDYFKEILEETPCKHPFILVQNANGEDLKALLDFIYVGEISVESERMESFLKLAQNLEVRGFAASVKNETQSSIPSPAPPSDFCVNMTELGKRVQNPGVEDSYEVPESPKKNWGPKSKRKRGREPSPPMETMKESLPPPKTVEKPSQPSTPSGVEDSHKVPESYRKNWGPKSKRKKGKETSPPMETMREPSSPAKAVDKPSRPTRTMKESSPQAKTMKETFSPTKTGKGPLPPIKTAKPKQEKRIRESPPPIQTVKPKEEPLEDFQMTTEKDKVKSSMKIVGKPMVIIEDCPAAIELSRTPKDGKVSVMIAPMENCLTLGDSDDDFFDDKRQPDSRNSKRPMPKRAKKDFKKKMDKKEKTEKFSSGTEHDTQEYFQFAVKEEGELDCQNGNTATTSNHSTVEKREAIKVTFKVKDNNEMVYDIVSPKEKRLRKETPKPSLFEELAKAGTSKDYDDDDDDDEVKKKSLKKRKGKKQFFQCQYCPYKTPISVNLRVHLRTHTGEKPFVCSLCPYKSTQSSALRKHMQTHVQNKKVKCPHCEFKTRFGHEELKEHLKSHTDTTTYQCEDCNFITNRYQTLQRHELKNHFKSSNIYIDEDSSSQSKKIVKKCNPYKSRKRSIL
ncbi:Broad-complex core protein isoform 6, partial [Armadillidium nasatum]